MSKIPVRLALRDAMAEEMHRDPNVFLMGEEVAYYNGAYKVSQDLLAEFGNERVLDTPITEAGFAGIGVGAAMMGLRPIIEFMTFNFSMQAIDHIINSAAKTLYMSGGQINCPIVFRGSNSVPRKVAAQHSQCFASWYAHCPGLKVVAPHTSYEAKALLKSAIRDDNPVIFLEHEAIGVREGSDITITAFAISVEYALEAAQILQEKHGISAEVINLVSLRPLDKETIIRSVKKTNRIINIEEGWMSCGIGSEITSLVVENAFDYLDHEPMRISTADVPEPYSPALEELAVPNAQKIIDIALKML